mmetsp:Transcript_25714/g.83349  ORF Transcript_25714/g.83349 Transcript_25714/m.83349 type:complete len:1153 (+) Transcript_25714:65-3523(+)
MLLLRLAGLRLAAAATWTTQSPLLPRFEWVVLDHADGNSMGYGVTIAGEHAFVSGSMKSVVRVENPSSGVAVESTDQGSDGDVFLAKVDVDGVPISVWTYYGGTQSEFPAHLAASSDGTFVAMTGYFAGTITFGDYSFTNPKDGSEEIHARELDDGFVVKIAAADGAVLWAVHVSADGGATCAGTAFDATGNVAVVGRRCDTLSSEGEGTDCVGFAALLAADDGSTIWERDFGTTAIPTTTLSDVAVDSSHVYVVGSIQGAVTVDGIVDVASKVDDVADALLLVFDVDDGSVAWAATASGDGESASSTLVEILGDAIYMNCVGTCLELTSTAATATVTNDGLLDGSGVFKLSKEGGVPLWGADTSYSLGLAVTADAVYVNYHATGEQTYGDTTFEAWGSWDHYVVKIDAETGAGEWVIQTGGIGLEYVRRMAVDAHGDLYSVGLTQSDPAYFDPLTIETHDSTDGYDVFLAKLATSNEQLPSCKSDATTIANGFCFINNVCYEVDAPSRALLGTDDACLSCSPGDSQTSFTLADGFRLAADGTCAATTTWTTMSSKLPTFEWVVLDHGFSESYGFFSAVADDGIFVSGVMGAHVTLTNPLTGHSLDESVESSSDADSDIYIAKVSFDGAPLSIWRYPSTTDEFAMDMTYGSSDTSLALVGYFLGEISFGGTTLSSGSSDPYVAFVVVLSAETGAVRWARTIEGKEPSGSSIAYRPIFDDDGHLAVGGLRCEADGEWCSAFLALLHSDDGSTIWLRDFDPAFPRVAGMALANNKFYLSSRLEAELVVDGLTVSPESGTDALMLVLDSDGVAEWAALGAGESFGAYSTASIQVQVVGDAVYMSCGDDCRVVRTTASSETVVFDDAYASGIVKLTTGGVPLWAASLPTGWSIAANDDAVYINFPYAGPLTFGDTTFEDWGEGDTYVAKLDARTGAGEWIIQTGGAGNDAFVCSVRLDTSTGDLYHVGVTSSLPAYFDPIVVDTHGGGDDGMDLFIAKLAISDEKLPSCKSDATTIANGFCFINNVCYESGAPSRALGTDDACLSCSPGDSQTSFTVCQEPPSSGSGGGSKSSSSSSSGLGAGLIAVIAVVCVLLVAAALAGVYFVRKRREAAPQGGEMKVTTKNKLTQEDKDDNASDTTTSEIELEGATDPLKKV